MMIVIVMMMVILTAMADPASDSYQGKRRLFNCETSSSTIYQINLSMCMLIDRIKRGM